MKIQIQIFMVKNKKTIKKKCKNKRKIVIINQAIKKFKIILKF